MSGSMVERFPEDIRKKAETVWAETIWLSARAENPINAIAQALLDERETRQSAPTNLIEEAIEEHWGDRCEDYQSGCPTCEVWRQLDALRSVAPDTAQGTRA